MIFKLIFIPYASLQLVFFFLVGKIILFYFIVSSSSSIIRINPKKRSNVKYRIVLRGLFDLILLLGSFEQYRSSVVELRFFRRGCPPNTTLPTNKIFLITWVGRLIDLCNSRTTRHYSFWCVSFEKKINWIFDSNGCPDTKKNHPRRAAVVYRYRFLRSCRK